MGKRITIGAYEFTIEKPSGAAYDAFRDLNFQKYHGGIPVLFASCISEPSKDEVARRIANKPALKQKLVGCLEELAGAKIKIEPMDVDPAHPSYVRYKVGDFVVAFEPASEDQYDLWERSNQRSISDASLVLIQVCVKEPANIVERLAESPALKHGIASLIVHEAGMGLEVIEKKQEPPSDPS